MEYLIKFKNEIIILDNILDNIYLKKYKNS